MVLRTNKAKTRGQVIFESQQNVSVVKMPKLYSLSLIPRAYTVKERTNSSKLSSELHSMLCSTPPHICMHTCRHTCRHML